MLERTLQMRGVALDVPPDELPDEYWSYGENVFFRDLATIRIAGYESYYRVVGDVPVFVYPVQRTASSQWIIVLQRGADTLCIRWDGSSATTLHTYAGLDALQQDWQATDHNGVIVLNYGGEAPRYWKESTDTMELLPDWPANAKCKAIRSFKYHLVAMNLTDASTDNPYEFMWSDQSEPNTIPQSWTAAADTDAGNGQLASPQGHIVDGIGLRDGLLIFKNFSTHVMTYIGGVNVFSQRELYVSAGMIAPRCAVVVSDLAYIITQDDVISTDGYVLDSIATHQIRREIFSTLNPDAIRYVQLIKRHPYDEIWVCWPAGDSEYCNRAAVYNTRTERWGFRDLPEVACLGYGLVNDPGAQPTWGSRATNWGTDPSKWGERFYSTTSDEIVMAQPVTPGGLDGYVYVNDRGISLDGVDMYAEVRREGIVLDGNSETVKMVTEVWPHVQGRTGDVIYIQVGSAYFESEPIKWQDAKPYTIGAGQLKIDVFSVGRLTAFRFYSNGGGEWRLYDFRVRYAIKGRF